MVVSLYSRQIEDCLPYPTLFIHGNLASSKWWEPTIEAFKSLKSVNKNKPAILADMRGCGKNPDSTESFTIFDLAQDFISILNEQNLPKVHIVGHSVGGLIALAAMVRAPDKFSRCVLLDPVGPKGILFDQSMYDAFTAMANDKNLTAQVILGTIYKANLTDEFKQFIVSDAFKAVKGVGSNVLEMLKDTDISTQVATIQQPVLVLHGQFDSVLKIEDSRVLASQLPNGKFQEIRGHGHCLNIEDPKKLAGILKDFLFGDTK
ncbi:MAG: alpha/beta fold hydrolase [Bdellovibrionales bacterium]